MGSWCSAASSAPPCTQGQTRPRQPRTSRIAASWDWWDPGLLAGSIPTSGTPCLCRAESNGLGPGPGCCPADSTLLRFLTAEAGLVSVSFPDPTCRLSPHLPHCPVGSHSPRVTAHLHKVNRVTPATLQCSAVTAGRGPPHCVDIGQPLHPGEAPSDVARSWTAAMRGLGCPRGPQTGRRDSGKQKWALSLGHFPARAARALAS